MKIVLINSMCGTGSTGRIISDLYSILKDGGNEVKIISGLGKIYGVDKKDVLFVGGKLNYFIDNVMSKLTDLTGSFSKRATKRVISFLKDFRPDIIHLHNLHGYWINFYDLFNYLATLDIPIVWTLHDCWPFTGHCSHFDYVGCQKWKTVCHKCPLKKEYPSSFFFDRSKSNYLKKKKAICNIKNLTIVTPSNWLAGLAKQSYLGNRQVFVIHNGINLDIFNRHNALQFDDYKKAGKKIILTVAGNWNSKKGLYDFYSLQKMSPQEYVFVIVGLTNKQRKKKPDKIVCIPKTNSAEELATIYSSSDVFINLTYEDTYPTVNLEAQACGLPVITYRTGGSPESIIDNCGFSVSKGDYESIPQFFEKAFSIDKEIIEREAIVFSNKNTYKKYLDLYKTILDH